jgi:transcriptional regulator with XRE-family HTH domain
MTTGLLIKTAREKAGMSQAQLASKMGVTNHCISSWERGKRNPKYETLSRIADALGVDVNCLLLGNDVVAVVRCQYCHYFAEARVNEKGFLICPASGMEITGMDYCSYGERRDDDA